MGTHVFYRCEQIEGNQKLECELTLRAGEVVWDLNGISRLVWNASQ